MMNCPHCHREIADYSNYCYFCGSRQGLPASPSAGKRLMRSSMDIKVAGVCAGFAEYINADATIIRLVCVLVTLATGIIPGLVVYAVAWAIMPVAPVFVNAPAAERPPAQHPETA